MKKLNLPKTDFPQKADGNLREPMFNEMWERNKVFEKRSDMNNGDTFRLHDGPPYANGMVHMGHTLNKLLKDVVNKYKLMTGHKVYFRPGWDCHGLPTELKVTKDNEELSTFELRKKCEEHANKYVNLQRDFFKRLGLMGDWENPYLTMNRDYELKQLEAFYNLYEKGLLYRDEKPVYYSPSTKTVLADSELEYQDREDVSVYFKFPTKNFNLVCWTTMPWTVPGNKGVCVNPNYTYKVVKYNGELLLVLDSCDLFGDDVKQTFKGHELENLEYTNPLNDDVNFVMTDSFVKDDSGTGLVHLCPAHGDEDFRVCKSYGVEPKLLLDEDGNFLSNGLPVLEEGAKRVLDSMFMKGMKLKEELVTHSYPHDWRTHKPVVFMLTKQFFVSLTDKDSMLEEASKVDFSKNAYKNRFKGMLLGRDSWCVSRQRKWGFPLPVFFDGDNLVFDKDVYEHLYKLFEENGSNCWFNLDTDELLPDKYRGKNFTKCQDTLDVWMDSGLSWFTVMNGEKSDLYFEGSDQHRGWFQSSFVTSLLLNGESPYKKVLTHGFVLDENGKKMAKSVGNVVDPRKYLDMYNADVLRLWALSVNYTQDVRVGDKSVKTVSNVYFRLRNTFKYLLSNLYDYDESYKPSDFSSKDFKELNELDKYLNKMKEAYGNYDFMKLFNMTTLYFSQVSKRYFDLETKELLYEGEANSKERRNRQYVMNVMLNRLVVCLAPMSPYLCEDVYQYMNKKESVFYEDLN